MAKIFDKTDIDSVQDRALVLNTNEAILRKMDLPEGWTEVRLGMFLSPADYLTGLNSWVGENSINQSVIDNSYCFGIKDESITKISETGSSYIGVFSAGVDANAFKSSNAGTTDGWVRTIAFANYYLYCAVYNDASKISYGLGSATSEYLRMYQTGGASKKATVNFAGVSIKLQKGTTTKAVVSLLKNETITSETDVSNENMRQRIFNSPASEIATVNTWFSGNAPSNLNSFFFKLPMPTICACVHNYGYVVT